MLGWCLAGASRVFGFAVQCKLLRSRSFRLEYRRQQESTRVRMPVIDTSCQNVTVDKHGIVRERWSDYCRPCATTELGLLGAFERLYKTIENGKRFCGNFKHMTAVVRLRHQIKESILTMSSVVLPCWFRNWKNLKNWRIKHPARFMSSSFVKQVQLLLRRHDDMCRSCCCY